MTLERTEHRRQAVNAIHNVVSALRAIAAGRIHSAQRALAASRRYEQVVRRALAVLLRDSPGLNLSLQNDGRCTLLVMTSGQPLCGSFNQKLLALVERRWPQLCVPGPPFLVLVGRKSNQPRSMRGITPDRIEPAATTLAGVRDLIKRLTRLTTQRLAAGNLGALRVIYNRYQSVSEEIPTEELLLPLDADALGATDLPLDVRRYRCYLPPADLALGLMGELALISLYRVAAESFASEQASRLVAMDGAARNTERMAESLAALAQRERQDEITREVLELVNARFTAGRDHTLTNARDATRHLDDALRQ